MNIASKDLDELNAQLSILIEPDDYLDKFYEELKKQKSKAHMKGFRKGKTPVSAIKKMYGKSILAEIINDILQKQLNSYLKDEKIEILGNPLPSEEQEQIDFDLRTHGNYEFFFDLGLAPEFEIKGVGEEDSYESYEVKSPEEDINEELTRLRKRHGKTIHPLDDINEDDIITIEAKELEGKNLKEKGWETAFTLLVNRIGDEKVKKQILKLKTGDSFRFDINTIEKDTSEAYVKKYLLNLDADEEKEIGNEFEGLVKEVSRIEPAEFDKDFFDVAFGEGEVNSEAEAKSKIEQDISKYYKDQQKNLTYRHIMDRLVSDNIFPLPEEFLKRWIKMNNKEIEQEQIDKEFQDFGSNLRWTLIKSKLSKKYEIEIQPDEIKEAVKLKLAKYIDPSQAQGLDMEAVTMNYLSRENQLEKEYEEMLSERLFAEICNHVELKTKKVTLEEFKDLVQKVNKKNQ